MDSHERSTSMNISLPKALRNFVEERVSISAYTSASEYIRELIRKDRDQRAKADQVERQLLEGFASGEAEPFDDDFFEKLKGRIRSVGLSGSESA